MGTLWAYVGYIALVVLVAFNIFATYIVLNTHFGVKARRPYQIIFIWAVPIIGAAMAAYLNREDDYEEKFLAPRGGEARRCSDGSDGH